MIINETIQESENFVLGYETSFDDIKTVIRWRENALEHAQTKVKADDRVSDTYVPYLRYTIISIDVFKSCYRFGKLGETVAAKHPVCFTIQTSIPEY